MTFIHVAAALMTMVMLVRMLMKKNGGAGRPASMKKNEGAGRPPGPAGSWLPFIGNLLQFDKSNPHIYLWQLSRNYGPLVSLKHGSTPMLVVSSMELANQILKTHDSWFCSRPPVLGQQKLSYGGLDVAFSPYNQHWKQTRKICALHLLSPKQVLAFRSVREDEVYRMIAGIMSTTSSAHDHPVVVNMSIVAMSLATNLICRMAFGRRYDDDEYDKRRLDRLVMEAQTLMVSFYFSDHFPALRWVDKVTGLLDRLNENCREMDMFNQQLIDEHLLAQQGEHKEGHVDDIIDIMIRLKNSSSTVSTWDDQIKALLMDLFVAGTDTVAAAIVWTMTALMLNPSIMNKAQKEIRSLKKARPLSAFVDEDDIKKLPYLKAVVLESLRLNPPAPLLYRTQILSQDKCVRVDGYDIEPGTDVIINGWAIGRDPKRWEDAEEFRPERFMRSSSSDDDEMKDAFEMILPFGGGRRGCPGRDLGLVSVHLTLANLLYSFDWAVPQGNHHIDIESIPGLTTHKKNPLLLVPTRYDPHTSPFPN